MKTTRNPKKSAVLLTAKTRLPILRLFIILCGTFAMTSVFGQTTFVWTNQYPGILTGTGDMNQSTNWSPNGVPNPMVDGTGSGGPSGDLILFDGRTTGPLSITESGGTLGGGGGQSYPAGARLELTANQTNSVTIVSPGGGTSGGYRMNWFTIDAGAGGLIIGNNNSVDIFDIVGGELNGQIQGFTNNSSVTCVMNAGTRFRMGGAGFHPHVFAGTGDWIVK